MKTIYIEIENNIVQDIYGDKIEDLKIIIYDKDLIRKNNYSDPRKDMTNYKPETYYLGEP